ncbi:MAG: STAS domain-containing protein [Wenzhouxiangella sp.]
MRALSGKLTMQEVPAVYQKSLADRKAGPLPDQVDLAGLERTDSSALALLLEWQSWARAQGQQIEFANPPESLQILAGLSQTGDLLGWTSGEEQQQAKENTK